MIVIPTGKLLSRITYDSRMIANSSSSSLVTIVREGAYLISLLVVMLYTSWELTLVLFVIGPIIAVLIRMVSKIFVSSVKYTRLYGGINLCNGTNAERA